MYQVPKSCLAWLNATGRIDLQQDYGPFDTTPRSSVLVARYAIVPKYKTTHRQWYIFISTTPASRPALNTIRSQCCSLTAICLFIFDLCLTMGASRPDVYPNLMDRCNNLLPNADSLFSTFPRRTLGSCGLRS